MSETIQYRLAARCEAAGRPNNEDNYHVSADISKVGGFTSDEIVNLGEKGAILVVCDGMGGMNAGEVASDIATKTIKAYFEASRINNDVLATDATRCEYIIKAIQAADANIKNESRADEAKRGMGSTIVMAWLLEGKAYVGWCGDGRAYKYNPNSGLSQMSHDHSYVQELVDAGKLSPELAFDHPNGNIITRSLGDPRGAAQPDVKVFDLEINDEILLCSDGLCGILRNNEIERVMQNSTTSMVACRDALWEAARAAGWHDNVTIVLAQIMPKQELKQEQPKEEVKTDEKTTRDSEEIGDRKKLPVKFKKYAIIAACVLLAIVIAIILILWKKSGNKPTISQKDSNITTDVCSDPALMDAINHFCDINNPLEKDPTDAITKLKNYILPLKYCNDNKNKVLQQADTLIKKLDKSTFDDGETYIDERKKLLTNLKNELTNN